MNQGRPALAELARRELARRDLLTFTKRFVPKYDACWAHEDIAWRLMKFFRELQEGKNPHLILQVHPRFGKSQMAGMCFIAWILGQDPSLNVISASYGSDLAVGFSKAIKAIIVSPEYKILFPKVIPSGTSWSNESWELEPPEDRSTSGGKYFAMGVGGPATGRGADLLYIDDFLKNVEDATSAEGLIKAYEWYSAVMYTRLSERGAVLIVATPWADGDIMGRLISNMKDDPDFPRYEVVQYKAIATEYEYRHCETHDFITSSTLYTPDELLSENVELMRSPGEVLHPRRFSLERILAIKKTMSSRWFSSLYQLDPVDEEAATFKRQFFRRATMITPTETRFFCAWDLAISEKRQNDYTVGSVGGLDCDDNLNIPEIVRFKSSNSFYISSQIIALARRYEGKQGGITIVIEDGAIWRGISATFFKMCKEERFYPHVVLLKPLTDKLSRAATLQGRMEHGSVVFNCTTESDTWYDTMLAEMLRFPAGKNDDIVDSLAWLAIHAATLKPPTPMFQGKKVKSWKDALRIKTSSSSGHMGA